MCSNPSNPTGTVLSRETLSHIIQIAKSHNITVMSDEVFSPLFHTDAPAPSPFVSFGYSQSVSTGSVSKAHGLPGIRVGWVVSPNRDILQRVVTARDNTTISVSRLDDGVAAFALSPSVLPMLLKRNLAICKASITLIDEFITRNSGRCTWVKPSGGGTAFICFFGPDGAPVDDASFVARIGERTGVSFIPGGHSFSDDGADDFKGYVRMSIGDDKILRAGLERLQNFIENPKSYST
jgi:aspartate/methionine/tyrosine aminotransferase